MFLTADTTEALALARNDRRSLSVVKSGIARGADEESQPSIGNLLESLAAVIPTGIAAIYTLVGAALRTEMVARGSVEREAYQAAQIKAGIDPAAITKALEAMPLESKDLLEIRWAFLALGAVVAVVLAIQAVQRANKKATQKRSPLRLLLEPVTAVVAFLGWGLCVPGTPLGAQLSAADINVATMLIAGSAGLVALALGVNLTKPATMT